MIRVFPLDRFSDKLEREILTMGVYPRLTPIPATPWQAMSLLQKAIRRGKTELALRASANLLATSPDRFWRRAGIIAFEDVGVADLPTLGMVAAALRGKRFRQSLGGEWTVAAAIVVRMAAAPKNRAADDLLCLLDSWPGLAENRLRLARLPVSRLRLVALTAEQLPLRALALRMIIGDRDLAPARLGSADLGFDLLDEVGVAPTTLAIAEEGYRRTGQLLAPLVALLSLENGLREQTEDDPLPEESAIADLPGWALDMFTREGRAALAKLLQTDAGISAWARQSLPVAGRVEVLAQALFRVESGLCLNRRDGARGKELRRIMERECFGLPPGQADNALTLMRAAIPDLNAIRAQVMGGKHHA
ncbi:hypothetical protein [Neotabrizicola shimadae]|uniref:Uncharacterized protein n=1 Tax=Neotabrizicola shimadae TaxID=2807096 RepID=A0A8G1EAF5_9RHOB|nr:hypothetical protein [Neotabrizicola shimadae]QYZ68560.1 hypothetical protein JO391_12290 [Neotabrizicola shimadae]